jgi:hypothetical protein
MKEKEVKHEWTTSSYFCSCGQDTVTCQGCGRLVCGAVAFRVRGFAGSHRGVKVNVGPCCAARFGIGHQGT